MRPTYTKPSRFNLSQLDAEIRALNLLGFSGVSFDGSNVYLEFPDVKALDAEALAALAAVVAAHDCPDWEPVRQQREPLLLEADYRINRAEDAVEDTAMLRAYRQALRDVTKQADPEMVLWPTKPW